MGHTHSVERTARTMAMTVVVVSVVLESARQGYGLRSLGAEQANGIVMIVALALHAIFDARIRGTPIPTSAWWLLVIFWPLALPAYWIGTRGWRGVALILGATVALLAIAVVVSLATSLARFGAVPLSP